MRIIDSSLWFEYFSGTLNNDRVSGLIKDHANQIVPTICLYEVYRKLLTDKDEAAALSSVAFMKKGEVIDLSLEIAFLGAKLGRKFKLPLGDSVIYATAIVHEADVYTKDKHFLNLPNVQYWGGQA